MLIRIPQDDMHNDPRLPHLTVLFADDDEDIRALVEASVAGDDGITLLLCQRAEEALDVLQRESVDLIVADLNMPGMGGLGMIERLQGKQHPPVIITTAHPDALLPGSIDPPPAAVLAKPYDAPGLAKRLRQMHADCTRDSAESALRRMSERFKRELPSTLAELKKELRAHSETGVLLPDSVPATLREISAAATMYGLTGIAERAQALRTRLKSWPEEKSPGASADGVSPIEAALDEIAKT